VTGERGSALLLVPAGVLVLLALAGIAVDSAVVLLAQRELTSAAAAAANDAATQIDDAAFYRASASAMTLDPRGAADAAAAAVAARRPRGVEIAGPPVVGTDADRVTVTVSGRVRRVVWRGDVDLSARSTASATARR
jgi:Flp pilus assembly protein TadG